MHLFKRTNIKAIKKHYDQFTDTYLEVVDSAIQSHRSSDEQGMFDYYIDIMGIQDGMKLLDAGCGICGPAIYFARKNDVYIDAMNISATQIDIAKQKIDDYKLNDKITAVAGDFHLMHRYFDKSTYDIVYFLEAYGHSTNQNGLLESAAQVLKKGGVLYIKDYFRKDLPEMKHVNKIANLMNKKYAYNLPCLYHTLSMLRHLNFEILKVGKPGFNDDGGVGSVKFSEKSNIKLFKKESDMFSYADVFEILVKK
ncbi:MAG: class I SAM-dependent methyltransferase [Candidatus Delongbacteria bacterium]|jgi:cyclopropane fatty-acyl-phospholipid synthase-like methyltransferase|nr:class I SAM-dependent methyltransferase [Candidatus Delongbacteria bacterium]